MNKTIIKSSILLTLASSLLIGCSKTPKITPDLKIDNDSSITSLVKEIDDTQTDIEVQYLNYFETAYNSGKYGINFIRETPKENLYYTVWKENVSFDFTILIVMTIKLEDYKYRYWDSFRVGANLTLDDFSFVEIGKTTFEDIESIDPCWTYVHSGYSIHHLINGGTFKIYYDKDNVATKVEYDKDHFINDKEAKELGTLLGK